VFSRLAMDGSAECGVPGSGSEGTLDLGTADLAPGPGEQTRLRVCAWLGRDLAQHRDMISSFPYKNEEQRGQLLGRGWSDCCASVGTTVQLFC